MYTYVDASRPWAHVYRRHLHRFMALVQQSYSDRLAWSNSHVCSTKLAVQIVDICEIHPDLAELTSSLLGLRPTESGVCNRRTTNCSCSRSNSSRNFWFWKYFLNWDMKLPLTSITSATWEFFQWSRYIEEARILRFRFAAVVYTWHAVLDKALVWVQELKHSSTCWCTIPDSGQSPLDSTLTRVLLEHACKGVHARWGRSSVWSDHVIIFQAASCVAHPHSCSCRTWGVDNESKILWHGNLDEQIHCIEIVILTQRVFLLCKIKSPWIPWKLYHAGNCLKSTNHHLSSRNAPCNAMGQCLNAPHHP